MTTLLAIFLLAPAFSLLLTPLAGKLGTPCHFVDFLTFLNGSLPVEVFAEGLSDPAGSNDTVTVNLRFQNGSIGTIAYVANGSRGLFKEYVEVRQAGVTLATFKILESLFITRYRKGSQGGKI